MRKPFNIDNPTFLVIDNVIDPQKPWGMHQIWQQLVMLPE